MRFMRFLFYWHIIVPFYSFLNYSNAFLYGSCLWYKAGMYRKRKENIYSVRGVSGFPWKGERTGAPLLRQIRKAVLSHISKKIFLSIYGL